MKTYDDELSEISTLEKNNQGAGSGTTLLIVCNVASSYTGNFGSSIVALANAARRLGWTLVILLPEKARYVKSSSAFEGFSPVFFPFSPLGFARELRKMRRELPGDERVLVHLNFLGPFETAIVKHYFKHIVFHFHMAPKLQSVSVKERIKEAVKIRIYRNVTLIGVSDPVASALVTSYPLSACVSVPNAIDFHRLGIVEGGSSKPSELFRLGVFGNDFERKGVDIAIEAVSLARLHGVPCKLEIYVSEPSEMADTVEKIASESNLSKDFVSLNRTRENVASIYNTLDVFMSPSRSEAFCTAVVEASYCAPQVIASLVPGQDSLREIPGTIWFDVKKGAPSLAKAIEEAWRRTRSEDLAGLKERQRRFVLAHYSLDDWVGRMLDVFEKSLDE